MSSIRREVVIAIAVVVVVVVVITIPWPVSASELYRPSNRRLSAKLVSTFADKGCHVVRVTDPYGRILVFIDRSSSTSSNRQCRILNISQPYRPPRPVTGIA
jgi:hypothetical protein